MLPDLPGASYATDYLLIPHSWLDAALSPAGSRIWYDDGTGSPLRRS